MPWFATHKSGFLKGLSFFWNSWAVHQNIVLAIYDLAASWMIRRVVHHKGGLHNRITKCIFLEPFNLSETKEYLESRNLHFDLCQIVQLYMIMGGIPHYLKEIENDKSAIQNINQICFTKNGMLSDEFLKLYPSLLTNAEKHISIPSIKYNFAFIHDGYLNEFTLLLLPLSLHYFMNIIHAFHIDL